MHVLIGRYKVRVTPVTPSVDVQDQNPSFSYLDNFCSHGFIFISNHGDTKLIMTNATQLNTKENVKPLVHFIERMKHCGVVLKSPEVQSLM